MDKTLTVDSCLSIKELCVINILLRCGDLIEENDDPWVWAKNCWIRLSDNMESILKYTVELYRTYFCHNVDWLKLRRLSAIEELLLDEDIQRLSLEVDLFKSWLLSACRIEIESIRLGADCCQIYFLPKAAETLYHGLTGASMPENWFAAHGLYAWQDGLQKLEQETAEGILFHKNGRPVRSLRILPRNRKPASMILYNMHAYVKFLKDAAQELERQPIPHLVAKSGSK